MLQNHEFGRSHASQFLHGVQKLRRVRGQSREFGIPTRHLAHTVVCDKQDEDAVLVFRQSD